MREAISATVPPRVSLPAARGALSKYVLALLRGTEGAATPPIQCDDPVSDDDLQLALYLCYELHQRKLEQAGADLEWDPVLLTFRSHLEREFLGELRDRVGEIGEVRPRDVPNLLFELAGSEDGPSLSRRLERAADLAQFREFLAHRSAYQLKEADPHSWAIPRLRGAPKSALVEIQADEYGSGRPDRMHSELFAKAMRALGLDAEYGAYVDVLPGATLATVNLMSLFGLHRRLKGAIVGHLALFEMTSPIPNRRYGNGLRRLGFGEDATDFFDEHVEADSVHENIAAFDLAGGLAAAEPAVAPDIIFGARCLMLTDELFASHLISAWDRGEPSLLRSLPAETVSHA